VSKCRDLPGWAGGRWKEEGHSGAADAGAISEERRVRRGV
jgi:hypothetical protein